MRRRPKPPKFSGDLAEPIVIEPQFGLFAYESNEDLRRRRYEKVLLLLKYYHIQPSDKDKWLKLSMRLAHDFVDGMTVIERAPPSRPGPKEPRFWTDPILEKLVRSVDKILTARAPKRSASREKKIKIHDAICEVLDDPFWHRFKGHEQSLVTRYHEGKKRMKTRGDNRSLLDQCRNLLGHDTDTEI